MAKYLRQSTATTIVAGPFVDSTDGFTAETALTISQGDVLVWKEGGTSFNAKNEATSATHRSNGCYTIPLDTTDTNTVGQFIVSIAETGALPVRHDFFVVPTNVFQSLTGVDVLDVNVAQINSSTSAPVNLSASANVILLGTVTDTAHTPTTTAFRSLTFTEATDDHFIGRVVIFRTGALAYQATVITDYDGATQVLTVEAMTEAPASGDTFAIV